MFLEAHAGGFRIAIGYKTPPPQRRRSSIDTTLERKHLLAALNRVSSSGLRWKRQTGVQIEVGEHVTTLTILNETGILRQPVPCQVSSSGSLITTHHTLSKAAKQIKRETLRLYSDPDGYFLAGDGGELERILTIPPQSLTRFQGSWQDAQWNSRVQEGEPLIQESLRCSLSVAALREALQAALSSAREEWMFGPGSGSCVLFHIADPTLSVIGRDGLHFSAAQLSLPRDYVGPRDESLAFRPLDLLVPVPSLRTLLNTFPTRSQAAEQDLLEAEGTFARVGDTSLACSGKLVFRSPALKRELAVPLVDSLYIRYPSWSTLSGLLTDQFWTARLEVPRRQLLHLLVEMNPRYAYWITLKFAPGSGQLFLAIPRTDQQEKERTAELKGVLAEGNECSMNVSPWSLMGYLDLLKSETAIIEYRSPQHPVKIRSGQSGRIRGVTQLHALGVLHPSR